VATDISTIRDKAKSNMLDMYARTNRDGAITATIDSWATQYTVLDVTSVTLTVDGGATRTLTFNADELIGKHVYINGVARRITENAATASGKTRITVTSDFPATNVSGQTSCEIRDGFFPYAQDTDLERMPFDRHYRVILEDVIRDPEFGNRNMGRYNITMTIDIVYQILPDFDRTKLRAMEDAQSAQSAMLADANQPSNGAIFFIEGGGEISKVADDNSWLILSVPVVASFTASTVED